LPGLQTLPGLEDPGRLGVVLNEQLALINQLDEDEKNALVKIINSMLTKKRMKDLLDGNGKF